jgi:septum site-determining protein MinC
MTCEETAFKIKTGNLPVLKLHLLCDNLDRLKQQLEVRLSQTPDFFASTPIVLELTAIEESDALLDFSDLVSFMREHGMCATGITGGSAMQRADAVSAGLGLFPDALVRNRKEPDQPEILQAQSELFDEPVSVAPSIETPIDALQGVSRPTMVIDKPVRTGQRIYAEGANLVVLAIVNAGAELIADGDIHVYAPLRGKAIAGAQGNEAARIFVQGMEAELLSIAGCFKVFEDGMAENVRAKPAQVRLDGSRLVIEPLNY